MEQKEEIQEEKKENRTEKALKRYDRYKQIKRLRDFIKRLRKRFQKRDTTQAEEPLESTPEEPLEAQEIPQAGAGTEAEAGAGTEGVGEGEVGAETGIEAGAEVGAETTGAELAGTEAGSIIETAAAESASAEALGTGAGAEIGGVGITTGAEAGTLAGMEVGTGTGLAAATGVGAGEATAGIGAVGAAGAGAVGAEGAAIVGGGAGVAAAGAGGAGAAAAGAGGTFAIGGGVVAAESNPVGWIITAVILVIIIFVVLIIILTGGGTGLANPSPGGGIPGSGNISSCAFTRSGTQQYTIKSSVLASWITDAANKAGIPPAVLASMLVHESLDFFSNTTDDSNSIKNNYYCSASGVSCTKNGRNLHVGACTPQEISNGAATDTHRGILQISDYFYPNVNACSITESLAWAANKLKNDGGITVPPSRDQVIVAIMAYGGFGTPECNTHVGYPYNYCEEVWEDYQKCQTPSNIATDCPIPNGNVICGSYFTPAANGCAHCNEKYKRDHPNLISLCNNPTSGIQSAIDIAGNDFDPVYLPKIKGSVIKWTWVKEQSGSEAIQYYAGIDQLTNEQYFISFHHTQYGSGNPGIHFSGEVGANICGNGCNEKHVHVQIQTVVDPDGGIVPLDAALYFCKK